MPSPACQIPCAIVGSDLLVPLESDDCRAYLPRSIAAGHTGTSEDVAKVLLAAPNISPRSRQPYIEKRDVALRAIMPWLDRELTNFDVKMSVVIQYPLDIRHAQALASVAPGTQTEVSWQVSNAFSPMKHCASLNMCTRYSTRATFAWAIPTLPCGKRKCESPYRPKTEVCSLPMVAGCPPWTFQSRQLRPWSLRP